MNGFYTKKEGMVDPILLSKREKKGKGRKVVPFSDYWKLKKTKHLISNNIENCINFFFSQTYYKKANHFLSCCRIIKLSPEFLVL